MNSKWFAPFIAVLLCTGTTIQASGIPTKPVTDPVDVFEQGVLQTVGISQEGQTRYKALREAQLQAHRALETNLKALRLSGGMSIQEGMERSVEIKAGVKALLGGVVKCGQVYHQESGAAEVCMQIAVRGEGGVYASLVSSIQAQTVAPGGDSFFAPVDGAVSHHAGESNRHSPPVPYDGLIVDTRGCPFSPALVNRVLAGKEDVLYTPALVQNDLLAERGCCGVVRDEERARALLESWGSTNPLLAPCIGVREHTDAILSEEDAVLIYVNDQKTGLFSQGRVVFVTN